MGFELYSPPVQYQSFVICRFNLQPTQRIHTPIPDGGRTNYEVPMPVGQYCCCNPTSPLGREFVYSCLSIKKPTIPFRERVNLLATPPHHLTDAGRTTENVLWHQEKYSGQGTLGQSTQLSSLMGVVWMSFGGHLVVLLAFF